jgi:hypothetical protein
MRWFRRLFPKKVGIFFDERPYVNDMRDYLIQINSPYLERLDQATGDPRMNEGVQVQYMRGVNERDAAMIMLRFGGSLI